MSYSCTFEVVTASLKWCLFSAIERANVFPRTRKKTYIKRDWKRVTFLWSRGILLNLIICERARQTGVLCVVVLACGPTNDVALHIFLFHMRMPWHFSHKLTFVRPQSSTGCSTAAKESKRTHHLMGFIVLSSSWSSFPFIFLLKLTFNWYHIITWNG